jgi:hypothetical protein
VHGVGRRTSTPAGGLLLTVALGACGSGAEPREQPAPAPVATVASPDAVSVSITAPANGETLTLATGRRTGRLLVTGLAAPGSGVRVVAGCRPAACERQLTADGEGRWRTRLKVRTSAGQRQLAVSAEPSDAGSAGAANSVLVLLKGATPARKTQQAERSGDGRTHEQEPEPPRQTTTPVPGPDGPSPASPATRSDGRRPTRVFLVGDSLAEGIAGLLPGALPGRTVSVDAKISRPLATGMALARTASPGTVLAISLFTNDDPRAVGRLDAAVRESARIAGPDACAVWATIVRPPVGGVSYAAANARLEALAADPTVAGTVRIVPWARAVAANPGWVAGDGVHATPQGYRARARLYAQAIDGC